MEQCVFYLFIDYRGSHSEGIKIYNAYVVDLQKKTFVHSTKICHFTLQTGENKEQGSYSQHYIFFITYELAQ